MRRVLMVGLGYRAEDVHGLPLREAVVMARMMLRMHPELERFGAGELALVERVPSPATQERAAERLLAEAG